MAGDVTAFLLVYGDHPLLAEQFFDQWGRHGCGLPLRVGLNACGAATRQWVAACESGSHGRIGTVESEVNLGKAPMMRQMFQRWPIETEWVVWFDDDSFPFRGDWLTSLQIAMEAQPEAVMLGVPAEVSVDDRVISWIKSASWYRGVPLRHEGDRGGRARIEFILGGFWALRAEWIRRLDWPDRRLRHFGDDFLLGEAIRQQGGRLGYFRSGVRIDTAPRRAPSEWRDEGAF